MSTVLTILALVPDFLRAAASAFNGTTLATAIDGILNTGASLIEAGDAGAVELQALTAQVKAMVAAGRDPTEDEWNALKARSDAAHAIIQGSTAPPIIQGSTTASAVPSTSSDPASGPAEGSPAPNTGTSS